MYFSFIETIVLEINAKNRNIFEEFFGFNNW